MVSIEFIEMSSGFNSPSGCSLTYYLPSLSVYDDYFEIGLISNIIVADLESQRPVQRAQVHKIIVCISTLLG